MRVYGAAPTARIGALLQFSTSYKAHINDPKM